MTCYCRNRKARNLPIGNFSGNLLFIPLGQASAPVTTKFVKDTAKAFAEEIFADAEAAPDLNEFLSRFTCAACGKHCLLAAPRCSVGNGSKGKATEIYQEMYPDVELFYIGEDIYSLL